MTPHFVFTHGWAMDGSLWDGLRAAMGDQAGSVRDLGYFGDAVDPPGQGAPVIAVCHSLGLMQTLGEPPPGLAGLVVINGFSRFSAAPDHPEGVPVRLLQRMLLRLEQDPDAAVASFRSRCGLAVAPPSPARPLALRRGLELLCHGDLRQALRDVRVPVLALAGRQDEIVPPGLSAACFDEIVWFEQGGHLLPLTHTDPCARALQAFARRHTAGRHLA